MLAEPLRKPQKAGGNGIHSHQSGREYKNHIRSNVFPRLTLAYCPQDLPISGKPPGQSTTANKFLQIMNDGAPRGLESSRQCGNIGPLGSVFDHLQYFILAA
jgi:hypothetical protein